MNSNIINSFNRLRTYCEKEDFKGWDPFDGLNSKVFQALPFKHWAFARLVWIQGFKRSPINFRRMLLVPKVYNSMGIALFLSGYSNIYKAQQIAGTEIFGKQQDVLDKINYLADLLISLQSKDFSGACWGYSFDWQARLLFLFPKNTPTVVCTCFAMNALMDAYEVTKNQNYLDIALSSAKFVINDLNRTPIEDGFILSYSPFKGNDTVINASLLGGKILSRCYSYSKNEEYYRLSKTIVETCCKLQKEDGSWVYGLLPTQSWIDSYHTGFNLDAIASYMKYTGDNSPQKNLSLGYQYYLQNFFEEDGLPIHFKHSKYPIDIHCPGELLVVINTLNEKDLEVIKKAETVLQWTIRNMQSSKGYFYYQIKKWMSSKMSYMRWSNAFMFNAMSNYIYLHSRNELNLKKQLEQNNQIN